MSALVIIILLFIPTLIIGQNSTILKEGKMKNEYDKPLGKNATLTYDGFLKATL